MALHFNWRRFVPSLGYHHVIMILLVATSVAWSILLAGCASSTNAISNVYLLSVSYVTPTITVDDVGSPALLNVLANLTQDARLQVRAAFFNICVKRPTIIQSQAHWDCASADDLIARYGSDVDPLGLIQYADLFASRIVFYGLIIGSLVLLLGSFVALATFPGWKTTIGDDGSEYEVKKFPSPIVLVAVVWALGLALALGFVSILWIHVGAVAAAESIESNYRHFVDASVGPAAMAVGWVAVALTAFVFVGILVTKLSVDLLNELYDIPDEE